MERTTKLILETEYKVTGVDQSVQKLDSLQTATEAVTKSNLDKVSADKKLEQAANQLNRSIDTQTKKQSEFQKAMEATGQAMNKVASTNKLKESFQNTGIDKVTVDLEGFIKAARSAESIEELTKKVDEFVASLPSEIKGDVIKLLDKEVAKLEKTFTNPISRLRELKRLINTETDPVLLKKYQIEAGKLQDELGDTNDLIRALASDTFFADTVVEGAQQAVGAFTAFQGIVALTTADQEKFAEAAAKAQGALALLQGVTSVITNLKKQDNIVTRTQILLQQGYAAVVGNSTGAMKGFRIALAATGIGLAVVAIGALVANWQKLTATISRAAEARKRESDIRKEGFSNVSQEINQLTIATRIIQDQNTTQEQRVRVINELQKKYPEYLKNVNAETATYDDLKVALQQVNTQLIIKGELEAREKATQKLQDEKFALEELKKERQADLEVARQRLAQTEKEIDAAPELSGALGGALRNQRETVTQLEDEIGNLSIESAKLANQISGNIQQIVKQSQDLVIGTFEETAEETAGKGEKALEGTIAFLEEKLSALRDIFFKETVIGSGQVSKLAEEIKKVEEQIALARAPLGDDKPVEILTEGSLKFLEEQVSKARKLLEEIAPGADRDKALESFQKAEAELQALQEELFGKEKDQAKEQNLELFEEEERHQLALQDLQGASELEKLETQKAFLRTRLQILREAGQEETDEYQRLENELTEAELRGQQLRDQQRKEDRLKRVEGIKTIIDEATQLASTLVSIEANRYAEASRLQEERVQRALEIAETGNVEVLKEEEKRQDEINKKRRQFANIQQAIALTEIAANAAVAISRAAAEGGAAAPFTIAATLLSLFAGIASARAQAQSLSFKSGGLFDGGGYTGDGSPWGVSKALGKKPYEYHNREYIMPDGVVSRGNNLAWLKKIHRDRIDIGEMVSSGQSPTIVNFDADKIVSAIKEQPGVTLNLNSKGIVSIVDNAAKRRNRMKSRK